MLRAVLVGLLSVSAVGCKSGGDSPASQPGVAAGKVVEVSGTVTVRHDNVARPLAKGEMVDGDDIVETGADGNVIIELAHNLARWELGANRSSKVRDSVAWGLAKKAGEAAKVEQDSAAAGRHAERSAAETSVSASKGGPADNESARAPAAAVEHAPAAPPPGAPPAVAPKEPATTGAPPPPPPKPATEVTRRRGATATASSGTADKDGFAGGGGAGLMQKKSGGGAAGGGAAGGGAAGAMEKRGDGADLGAQLDAAPAPAAPDTAARDLVVRNKKAIQACLTKDMPEVSLRITIAADGKATVIVKGKTEVPAAVQSCVTTAVQKLSFAHTATTVSIDVSR